MSLRANRPRSRSWIGAIVLVLIIAVLLGGAYAVTLGPEHYVQSQAVRVNGEEVVQIAERPTGQAMEQPIASLTPAADWSVRPLVSPLIGELQLLKSPAIYFGFARGVRLESPDGALSLTFERFEGADPEVLLETRAAADAPVQEEQLASGLTLMHADTRSTADAPVDGMIALIHNDKGGPKMLVRATLTDDARFAFDDYLPALSDLFETVEFAG